MSLLLHCWKLVPNKGVFPVLWSKGNLLLPSPPSLTQGFGFALHSGRRLFLLANPGLTHMPKMLLQNGRGAGTNIISEVLKVWQAAASPSSEGILYMKAVESWTSQTNKPNCRGLLLFNLAAFFQALNKYCD